MVMDRVVAVVNQDIITLSEVEKSAGFFREEIKAEDRLEKKEKIQGLLRKVLDKLIEEKLIDQEVKRAGIKVGSKDIEGALDDIKKRSGATDEDFERALKNGGITVEVLKKQIEKRLQRMKLINWAVKVEPKIGEKELRDFYQKNIDRYQRGESVRPCHILFRVPKDATPEQVLQIRGKCQNVLDKIKGGEDFGEMALLYSEDASSKDRGDLGFFKKGELLPAFEKEAFRLGTGEMSGIVRTDFGFHIIKLLDRRGGPYPFEEVKERVQADYYEAEMQKAFKEFISTLKERSVIEIKL